MHAHKMWLHACACAPQRVSADIGVGVSTVTFHYHMYGSTMGELRVTNAAGAVVWSLSGDQGNSWQAATVDVYSPSFAFEYTCGGEGGDGGEGGGCGGAAPQLTATSATAASPV